MRGFQPRRICVSLPRASAAERDRFARGREGLRLRGEGFQAEFRGTRRFAQQRVCFVQAPI